MNTNRTGFLGDAGDAVFDIARSHHHEVIQLIDHHDDERQSIKLFRGDCCGVVARVEFTTVVCGIEATDVAKPGFDQHVVATLHFFNSPAECICCFLWCGHRLRQKMRQARVLPHLNLLGVDENHPHLFRSRAHENRGDDAIEHARLAGTSGTGNQQVWRSGNIEEHRTPSDVFADCYIEWMLRRLRLGCSEQVAKRHKIASVVGNFDADCGSTRYGGQDTHVDGCHRIGDVFGQ